MPSNHLILCHPLFLPSSIFPSIRVFSNESVLRIRWPKYWSFSFSISPSNDYSGLISFRMDWCTGYPVFISTSCEFVPLNNTSPVLLQVSCFFFFFNMRLMYELIYALVIYSSSHPIQVPKNPRKQIINQKIIRWAWIQRENYWMGSADLPQAVKISVSYSHYSVLPLFPVPGVPGDLKRPVYL